MVPHQTNIKKQIMADRKIINNNAKKNGNGGIKPGWSPPSIRTPKELRICTYANTITVAHKNPRR
jgi:hypothetical protein